MKSAFFKPVVQALKAAGFEFRRRSNSSHHVYVGPGRQTIYLPDRIDDRWVANDLLRRANARRLEH